MDTSERLIESTRALLWERGYVATSPKVILERAGAGQGSMYHHFRGKADLALAAIQRTVQELRENAERQLGGDGPALERIAAYLRRERQVLNGCPVGRLTQDPDIVADPDLRRPVQETFDWLTGRLTGVLTEARDAGELRAGVDPAATAAAIVAAMQGGYVLAIAARDAGRFDQAVSGILALLDLARTP